MPKTLKTIKGTVGVLVKPVTGFMEGFNSLMRKIEESMEEKKEGAEIDNFVNILLKEIKGVEQGVLAFFTEMMFMQHLSEKMAQVENEVILIQLLGDKIKEFLSPSFVEIFLYNVDKKSLQLAYNYPSKTIFNPDLVKEIGLKCFQTGESMMENKTKFDRKTFSIIAAPLRTTREKIGAVVVGKKGKESLKSQESALVISGAVVISFAISNMKLVNNIIKNQRLVTIGETIGGLSHDTKNILSNLENGIELIDMAVKKKDTEMIKAGTAILKNSYERMKNLTLSMVDYSREREIELVPADINKVIKDAISIMRNMIKAKKIKLIVELDNNLPKIDIDTARIERMIINLLDNALGAVKEKTGIIRVKTGLSSSQDAAVIRVEDNGCGIPKENLERIFDVLYSTKGNRGTGFGLAVVQKIAKEHSGTIEVKSDVGERTVFIVKIPIKKKGGRK
ncbi:MAG: ATP-binding protein [Candidatus Ratteibacteria bacterium]|jgi:signal transduction histidine kinase